MCQHPTNQVESTPHKHTTSFLARPNNFLEGGHSTRTISTGGTSSRKKRPDWATFIVQRCLIQRQLSCWPSESIVCRSEQSRVTSRLRRFVVDCRAVTLLSALQPDFSRNARIAYLFGLPCVAHRKRTRTTATPHPMPMYNPTMLECSPPNRVSLIIYPSLPDPRSTSFSGC